MLKDTSGKPARTLQDAAEHMHREGGGVYGSAVMRPPFFQYGVALAQKYLQWAAEAYRRAREGEPTMLCLLCDAEFPPNIPGAMTVVTPMVDNPSAVVLSPVCEKCAEKHDDDALSTAAMRSVLPPEGSRIISVSEIHAETGHA